ncbi:MAG: membrane protein insertase YidC, partial [Desulfobulbus sp.]|nr:membrane protein insertase YidC [Desulfobulbus sp.]
MDMQRAFLAIVLSLMILVGFQYLFPPAVPQQPAPEVATKEQAAGAGSHTLSSPSAAVGAPGEMAVPVALDPDAADVVVDTPLYSVVIKEQGGGFESFVLKNYRSTMERTSGPMQLIANNGPASLPVLFVLDNGVGNSLPIFKAEKTRLEIKEG